MRKTIFALLIPLAALFATTGVEARSRGADIYAGIRVTGAPLPAIKRTTSTSGKTRTVYYRQRDAVDLALSYVGTKPKWTIRKLWCANFVNGIEQKVGRSGTKSNLARSYTKDPNYRKVRSPQRGDIGVFARGKSRKYGHVGYFVEWRGHKALIVSGNGGGNKVTAKLYDTKKLVAWVRPT